MARGVRQHLVVEKVEDIAVVGFVDTRIEEEGQIREISDQLCSVVEDGGFTKVLVNLGNVESMLSLTLSAFLRLNKRIGRVSGQLRLCNLCPLVQELFQITKLDRAFEIDKDEATALDKFAR